MISVSSLRLFLRGRLYGKRLSRFSTQMRGDVSGARIDAPAGVLLALPGHVVDDWRLGKEVIGNCFEVAVAEIFETIVDGFPHRALDLALLGRGAGSQELDNVVLFPFADPGIGSGVMLGTS